MHDSIGPYSAETEGDVTVFHYSGPVPDDLDGVVSVLGGIGVFTEIRNRLLGKDGVDPVDVDVIRIVIETAFLHLLRGRLAVVYQCPDFLGPEGGCLHVNCMQHSLFVQLHVERRIVRVGLYGHDG